MSSTEKQRWNIISIWITLVITISTLLAYGFTERADALSAIRELQADGEDVEARLRKLEQRQTEIHSDTRWIKQYLQRVENR